MTAVLGVLAGKNPHSVYMTPPQKKEDWFPIQTSFNAHLRLKHKKNTAQIYVLLLWVCLFCFDIQKCATSKNVHFQNKIDQLNIVPSLPDIFPKCIELNRWGASCAIQTGVLICHTQRWKMSRGLQCASVWHFVRKVKNGSAGVTGAGVWGVGSRVVTERAPPERRWDAGEGRQPCLSHQKRSR